MARLGRGRHNRPLVFRAPYSLPVHIGLPAFETADEFPRLDIVTPNAAVMLAAFETADEFPEVTLGFDSNSVLGVFETADEFPEMSVSVPIVPGDAITGNYQIEYAGIVVGGYGNQYQIGAGTVEGWDDLPAMDSGDVPRPTWHGSWGARQIAQERQITATIAINVGADDDFNGAVAALRRLLVPPEGANFPPLVVSTRDEILMSLEAVADSRVMPSRDYPQGWVPVAVRWTAPDPRRYNVARTGVDILAGLPQVLTNAGNVATHPDIRLDGPATNPVFANIATGRSLEFQLTLGAGERLVIDTVNGTAAVDGEPVMSALTGESSPVFDFVLVPGNNTITLAVSAGGGTPAVFLYRDAWL